MGVGVEGVLLYMCRASSTVTNLCRETPAKGELSSSQQQQQHQQQQWTRGECGGSAALITLNHVISREIEGILPGQGGLICRLLF